MPLIAAPPTAPAAAVAVLTAPVTARIAPWTMPIIDSHAFSALNRRTYAGNSAFYPPSHQVKPPLVSTLDRSRHHDVAGQPRIGRWLCAAAPYTGTAPIEVSSGMFLAMSPATDCRAPTVTSRCRDARRISSR
jgi:hypothetical protein